MNFDLVTASHMVCDRAALIKRFCELEGFYVNHLIDQAFVTKQSKGGANPTLGFVVLSPTGDTLLDIYDVVRYVEERGLKQC